MTIKLAVLILVFITTAGCRSGNQKNGTISVENPQGKEALQKIDNPKNNEYNPKKIGYYMSDTTDFFWCSESSEATGHFISVVFQKEFAVYQFNAQCIYWFFTNHYYTKTDKIELLWSFKTDCALNMDFLQKSNGVKNFPKAGDAFCEYSLVNDTVISVKYHFTEWTEKINELKNDSIFPKYLYLEKRTRPF